MVWPPTETEDGPCGVAGFAGAVLTGCGLFFSSTLPVPEPARVANTVRNNDVSINNAAATVVARDNAVAEPLGPNVVCEPIPPNAPAKSAALPLCSSTTTIKNKQTRM